MKKSCSGGSSMQSLLADHNSTTGSDQSDFKAQMPASIPDSALVLGPNRTQELPQQG